MKLSKKIELEEKTEQLIEDGLLIKKWNDKRRSYEYTPTELGRQLYETMEKMKD
mgnify:CR=1 FL=1